MLNYDEFYRESRIPEITKETIDNYIQHGLLPGRFVCSVLENNLKQTYHAADDSNLPAIPAIVYYLYNNAPSHCWGSPEAVKEWLEHKGLENILSPPV